MLGCKVRVARVEELIAMKVLANRSIDVADVASMLELHPKLDFAPYPAVGAVLRPIALDDPEIAARAGTAAGTDGLSRGAQASETRRNE